MKENLRPAIYELNKRGEAVVLDCLSEDEIARIMIERVRKTGKSKPVGAHKVKLSSLVRITSLDDGKAHIYRINAELRKNFPDTFAALTGKEINSVVVIRDEKFTITDIN